VAQDEHTLVDHVPRTLRSEVRAGVESGDAARTPTLTLASGPSPGRFVSVELRSRAIFMGRDPTCEFPIDDPSVSRRHARVYVEQMPGQPSRVVLQDLDSTNGTLVNGEPAGKVALQHGDRIHVGDVLLRFEMLDPVDIAYRSGLQRKVEESQRDGLTRLLSRQAMAVHLPALVERCRLHQWPVSAVMMDLDHFKRVNDTWGHQAGDDVLRRSAQIVTEAIRKDDLAIRYGGEEFLLVLAGARRLHARLLAERIREAVAAARYPQMPEVLSTVSLGVAERGEDEPVDSWIERADKALYRAKSRGRNRSEAAPAAREGQG
jgi:diguanylate cyclase (GGDEF)-like protein